MGLTACSDGEILLSTTDWGQDIGLESLHLIVGKAEPSKQLPGTIPNPVPGLRHTQKAEQGVCKITPQNKLAV